MRFDDLGLMPYRQAWAIQEEAHADVVAGGRERVLLVEHPAVITLGRRSGQEPHVIADAASLLADGVEIIETDRGGDVTYHAPGQLIAYPIIRLNDHRLSVGGYVHRLEDAVIAAAREFGVDAGKDKCAVGVWTRDGDAWAKLAAIGVRVKRGVTLHGLAINVTTDLSGFGRIIPCGLTNRPVTSLHRLLGENCPTMDRAKSAVSHCLVSTLGQGRESAGP